MNVKERLPAIRHPIELVESNSCLQLREDSHWEKCLSIKFVVKLTACLVLANPFSLLSAQQAEPAANPDSTTQTSQQSPATMPQTPADKDKDKTSQDKNSQGQASTEQSGTSKDRLFYALPNFLTLENAGQRPPLTTKQKYAVVARGSFDYIQIPWYGFLSGINQAEDSEPGFGQGAAGYGKRFATSFADGTIENFIVGAILPSLLHQDPRYFQLGQGSFLHRTFYAASRNVVTRTDSGKNQFNYSEIVGGALAASISTYGYHPTHKIFPTTTPGVYRFVPSDRTLSNTAKVWAAQYGYDTLTLVVKEFWPDIHRKISPKYRRESREREADQH
jgi:hypothetical protein